MAKRAHGEGTISRRPDGTWEGKVSLGYSAEGKRKRKAVYGKTRQEVKSKLDDLKRQIGDGTFSDAKLTVRMYLDQWLTEKSREVKPQTAEDYRYQLERYVTPIIGRLELSKLTPLKVQAMCGELADRISAQRANKCRRVLSGALSQAVRWQLIPRNPCDAVKPLKVPKTEMQLWTPEEAARFLDSTRAHRLFALFYLAMSTGMRRGELLGLRWQDIGENWLYVRQSVVDQRGHIMITTPKTEKGERRVALSPDVMEVMRHHLERQKTERHLLGIAWPDTGLVFTSEVGTLLHPRNFTRTWHTLQKNAGVRKVKLHDLRHLHASMAIKSGIDPKVLADRLGHARASFTLDVYTHLFEEQRASSAVSLLDFLPSAPQGVAN
jgi:integrase